MADDLDDFDLKPSRRPGDAERPATLDDERKGGLPYPAAWAVAVIGLVVSFAFVVFRGPKPQATPSPSSTATAAPSPAAEPSPAPAPPLPPLDASDAFVRKVAEGLSAHPELTRWLAQTALVRALTGVVANVAEGETPRPHLGFLAPQRGFRAAGRPGRLTVPDPESFADYDLFGDTVASVDVSAAVGAYRMLGPLFDAAYQDLGHPAGGFPQALERAIRALLAVPVLPEGVALAPHTVGFRYADPKLEALTPAQKQFLRTGPRNVRLVQGKLRELAVALAPLDSKSAGRPVPPGRLSTDSPPGR